MTEYTGALIPWITSFGLGRNRNLPLCSNLPCSMSWKYEEGSIFSDFYAISPCETPPTPIEAEGKLVKLLRS